VAPEPLPGSGPGPATATILPDQQITTDQEPAPTPKAHEQHRAEPRAWMLRLPHPRHWADWLLFWVVSAACGTRVLQWFTGDLLGNDDIALMYSVRTLPFRNLFGTLILNQGAPPGWIASERVIVELLGSGDRTVRILPMLFGCASVVAVAWLARMTLSRLAAVAATVLFGCAPLAIQYSWQVKPYSADMAAAAVLLAVAVWALRQPRWSYRHGMAWWLTAAAAAAFSFPSMFVTAASAAVLVLDRLFHGAGERSRTDRFQVGADLVRARCAESVRFSIPAVAWLAMVAVDYVVQLRHLKGSQNRHPLWIGAFGPEGGSLGDQASWSWNILNLFMTSMFAATATSVAVLLVVLGAVALWWRERAAAALLAAPMVAALLVAIAQLYPLAQRMALWLLPSAVVLLAGCLFPSRAGAEVGAPTPPQLAPRLREVEGVAGGAVAALLTMVLLVPSSGRLSQAFVAPGRGADADHTASAIAELARGYRPGDVILATESQYHRVYWYGHEHGLAPPVVVTALPTGSCAPDVIAEAVGDAPRVWLVTGSLWRITEPALPELAVTRLRAMGQVRELVRDGNVRLYLADLARRPDAPGSGIDPAGACLHTFPLPRWLG